MADQDIKMLIERIMAEARTHQSARFSHEVYADEPILKTGRQMQNFLPDQYRKMREISSGTMTVDSLKVAILAALHIADELHQVQLSQRQIDSQLGSRSSECSEMLDRVLKPRDPSRQEFAR